MQDEPTQRPPEQPPQPTAAPERVAPQPPKPRRRRGCLRTAIIIGATFLATVVAVVGVASYLLVRNPGQILEALRAVAPISYPKATAVAQGETVHVLYHRGALVPDVIQVGNRSDLVWRTEAFHGMTTDGEQINSTPIEPFTSAVCFQGVLWVLDTGSYRTWSDGAWSETIPMEWIKPTGCVAGGKLWVFYEDRDRVLNLVTTTDGTRWEQGALRQPLPALPGDEDEANRFLKTLQARFRVAVLDDRPYVFWYDPARKKVRFRFYEEVWSQPHSVRGSMLFAVAATDAVLFFFDAPVWRQDEDFGYDKATVTMRTFDGRRWSKESDELDMDTVFCLDASRVGDDIWLFTSGFKSLNYTIYSEGDWSLTMKVPRPEPPGRVPTNMKEEPEEL